MFKSRIYRSLRPLVGQSKLKLFKLVFLAAQLPVRSPVLYLALLVLLVHLVPLAHRALPALQVQQALKVFRV